MAFFSVALVARYAGSISRLLKVFSAGKPISRLEVVNELSKFIILDAAGRLEIFNKHNSELDW